MIMEHFGFQKPPFPRDIPTESLFLSSGFRELLARLQYTVANHLIALVTGETGTGKSTAIRALEARLDSSSYCLVYIADSDLKPRSFYEYALSSLAIKPPYRLTQLKELFHQAILDLGEAQGKHPVIVIDEAHSLGTAMLQEIRFLTNFHMDSHSAMSLILVGHPDLRTTLSLKIFEAVLQRIGIRYHLSGLSPQETAGYIQHQLKTAGYDKPLFTEEVIERIYKYTKGIPRMINNICNACLLDAAINNMMLVETANFDRALADLQQ